MLLSGQAHVVAPGEGRIVDLGVTRMKLVSWLAYERSVPSAISLK